MFFCLWQEWDEHQAIEPFELGERDRAIVLRIPHKIYGRHAVCFVHYFYFSLFFLFVPFYASRAVFIIVSHFITDAWTCLYHLLTTTRTCLNFLTHKKTYLFKFPRPQKNVLVYSFSPTKKRTCLNVLTHNTTQEETELHAIYKHFRADGTKRCVLIRGSMGIGKSSLVGQLRVIFFLFFFSIFPLNIKLLDIML